MELEMAVAEVMVVAMAAAAETAAVTEVMVVAMAAAMAAAVTAAEVDRVPSSSKHSVVRLFPMECVCTMPATPSH